MRIELLYFDGCPSYLRLLPRLEQLLRDAGVRDRVELRRVESERQAAEQRFLGSPTIRINGTDVEPGADAREDFGVKCRLYRDTSGQSPIPPDDWIIASLRRAAGTTP